MRLGNAPSRLNTIKPGNEVPANIQMKNTNRAEQSVPIEVTFIVPNLSHNKPIIGRPIPVDTRDQLAIDMIGVKI